MKPLHVGLLVVGAALAGGLAVRMSQPPMVAVSAPVSLPSPTVPPALPAVVAAPVQTPPPVLAETAAPAPVYTEPPQASRRTPFLEPVKPAVIAKVQPMAIGPAKYRETASPAPAVVAPVVAPPQPRPEPAAAPEPQPEREPVAAPPIPAAHATLHQGMPIAVRLNQSLSSEIVAGGDTFQATLEQPLIADGYIVAEKGARVTGRVVNAHKGGRFSENAEIDLALATVQTADGQRVNISTEPWAKEGEKSLGSTLGAIIGVSSGKPISIPSDTVIRFRLAARVSITERPL